MQFYKSVLLFLQDTKDSEAGQSSASDDLLQPLKGNRYISSRQASHYEKTVFSLNGMTNCFIVYNQELGTRSRS